MRGGHDAVGSVPAVTTGSTTRCPATAIQVPTRSDHDGPSQRAAAAALRLPRPGSAVCSPTRIRDGDSTALGHQNRRLPGTDAPSALTPLAVGCPRRAQQRGGQSADRWPCKPLRVAALGRLPVGRGLGRTAVSVRALRSAGVSWSAVPGAECVWWVAGVGCRAEWAGGAAERGGDRSGRRPRAASARGPRKRAALIQ